MCWLLQVDGCTADLSLEEKVYCLKKRICSYHMRAEGIMVPGDPTQFWRFCFQVGSCCLVKAFIQHEARSTNMNTKQLGELCTYITLLLDSS